MDSWLALGLNGAAVTTIASVHRSRDCRDHLPLETGVMRRRFPSEGNEPWHPSGCAQWAIVIVILLVLRAMVPSVWP